MNLFSENLGSVDTPETLALLQSQHSDLDPGYITLAAASSWRRVQAWIETWWKQFEPYADPNFLTEFKTKEKFAQRSWELYLGVTLLNRGFRLGTNGGEQPDFDVRDKETNRRLAWIEATSVGRGTGNDRVPEMKMGRANHVPIDQILLRLANGLGKKHQTYIEYVKKHIVKEDEPFVIAINRSETERVAADPEIPLILKALFGIGDLVIDLDLGEYFWDSRPIVNKLNKAPVSISFFHGEEHQGISVVMYCTSQIGNGPYLPEELGENICIVHDPLPKNPLPNGFFPFGDEYKAEGKYLKKIRSASPYRGMYRGLAEDGYGFPR